MKKLLLQWSFCSSARRQLEQIKSMARSSMTRATVLLRSTLAALGSAILMAGPAAAVPAFPQKPVTIIVPFPPGASLDNLVRVVAKELSEEWNQPVIVENRSGAGGIVGTGA